MTLSIKDNEQLIKQLKNGIKRALYWNEYKSKHIEINNDNDYIRDRFDALFQGIKRLFVLAYENIDDP